MGRMYSTALSLFSPLLAWYDRSPLQAHISYFATDVAPHTITDRATYTAPTGKKAFIGAVQLDVRRRTAATALAAAAARLYLMTFTVLQALHENNTVDSRRSIDTNLGGIVLPGQTLKLQTYDNSIGGAMDYQLFVVLTEFNA